MSKRLQVLLSDELHDEVRRVAQAQGVPVTAWVQSVLQSACRDASMGAVERKLAVIRAAAERAAPTADIDQMLAEIAAGRANAHGTRLRPSE